LNNCILKVAGL